MQVLFAFLLIVPFNTGFAHVGGFERTVYLVTLLLAALAAVCTIAPSAQHRWVFRHDDKRHLVFVANRVVIAGMAFLALAMCGCLLLVTTRLFGAGWGAVTAALASIPFLVLWFAIPIRRAAALRRAASGPSGPARSSAGGRRALVSPRASRGAGAASQGAIRARGARLRG